MKTFKLLLATVTAVALMLLAAPPAAAQDANYIVTKLVGLPLTMPTQSISNSFTNTPIVLLKDRPLTIWHTFSGTNSGAVSNLVFTYQFGYDQNRTNFATTPTLTATFAGTGSNTVVGAVYFTTNQLFNARTLRLFSIQNTNTQTITINKVVAGQFD